MIVSAYKITTRIDHKLDCSGLEIGGEMGQEIISLICEIAVVLDVGKSLHYLFPFHIAKEGQSMYVASVVVVGKFYLLCVLPI